eukprot:TRINITY_DN10481_c0_g1_i5.p1 TRINITY_DN10481_c0_g1~~TRINITY_DN10481_c0_g1_i5.p1  ORF type:complete len:700 (-),score=123.62 TRINITY_DN10481_c0_g1_i5:388-2466(-)
MGRRLKKGQSGNAAKYITRTRAINKLQLPLQWFRRLCILKGIHPREPKKKRHGAHTTYYHTKDVNWLQHEPLLKKFREIRAYQKKIKKAKNKFNIPLAKDLLKRKPQYQLDHLVRERYPSFIEALRDLDDPLTLVHLFATLPAESVFDIPKSKVQVSTRLALEWQAYIIRTHSLRKVFISVKGIYFQAQVMGQLVTWLIPHQVGQILPVDVDYRVMLTFLEFYQTLLQFVLFKLYSTLQLSYPPILDRKLYKAAEGLAALVQQLAGVKKDEDVKRKEIQPQQNQHFQQDIKDRLKTLPDKLKQLAQEEANNDEDNTEMQEANDSEDQQKQTSQKMKKNKKQKQKIKNKIQDNIDEVSDDSEAEEDEELPEIDSGEESDESQKQNGNNGAIIKHDQREEGSQLQEQEGQEQQVVMDPVAGGSVSAEADDEWAICETLFKGFYFFLGREVPKEPLMLAIRSFGGVVGWEGEESPFQQNDDRITHQVMDRPQIKNQREDREYVQPQWVFDSINWQILVDATKYRPGTTLPPHLSPFVDYKDTDNEYVPDYAKELIGLQNAARKARLRHVGKLPNSEFVGENVNKIGNEEKVPQSGEAVEKLFQQELNKELKQINKQMANQDVGVLSIDEDEPNDREEEKDQDVVKISQEEMDTEEMKDVMMSRKKRKMYNLMMKHANAKRSRIQELERKAKKLKR